LAVEKKLAIRTKKVTLPLLPLRGLAVFPYMILHFDVGRKKSISALEQAMINDQQIFLVAQIDTTKDEPSIDDIYSFGTVSKVKQLLKLPGGNIRVLVEGVSRAKLDKFILDDEFVLAQVKQYPLVASEITPHIEALVRTAKELFDNYLQLFSKISHETVVSVMNIEDPGELADLIAANIFVKIEDKLAILGEINVEKRIEKLILIMHKEMEILELEREISGKVKEKLDKNQKEYYLREQIKVIQSELGEKDGINAEINDYKSRIKEANMPDEVAAKLHKDLDRLAKLPSMSSDSSLIKTYIDTVLELPWNVFSKERFSLKRVKNILDEDHFGLDTVKERIIEFLAVSHLAKNIKGPILCLVGPPGVGKTSVAKSIARSLGRNYVRMSLGGVRDEAEIRGHRKTYIGAMPGRIINALKQAGSKNAFILLDEIDKMSSDYKGDPASAMLEVLDAEQNFAFRDHYMEVPFDLSEVMFVTTANSLETIPRPLLDRMEVIRISSYTEQEKIEISSKYLIPKQRTKHGLNAQNLKVDTGAIKDIVNYYTRESGVRNLERQIATICRKVARKVVEGNDKRITITSLNLDQFLGKRIFNYELVKEQDEIGVATGLAWTQVGGDTLQIEVNIMEGSGKLELTGHLGDVMKESAKAAISYIRSKADSFGIDRNFYKKLDIHIHVPEGATPKDGPSAGITMATALISALTGCPIKKDVAMTGEITLRGRVLPIGGLKEKVLAAHRAGIKTIIIPNQNEKDIDDIPQNIRAEINFILADNMQVVIENALTEIGTNKFHAIYENINNLNEGAGINQ